ncbi:MAG: response regulator [Candidatus Omnitrophica bacterium]|nr:response regulator [Candidatus Omnitrophota bacterium]
MNKKTIVIIDDEENFCKLVKKNIENTGEYVVFTATSGKEGIALVKQVKPDLVLLDVVMPEMDGTDVAAQIREDESIQNIPIVFLTAIASEDEAQAESQASITRGYTVLSKTATVKELLSCIKETIR